MPKDKEVMKDLAELIIEFFAVDENKKEFEKWQKITLLAATSKVQNKMR